MVFHIFFYFFKPKTAYVMRFSDWSSDVCSSDLVIVIGCGAVLLFFRRRLRSLSADPPPLSYTELLRLAAVLGEDGEPWATPCSGSPRPCSPESWPSSWPGRCCAAIS